MSAPASVLQTHEALLCELERVAEASRSLPDDHLGYLAGAISACHSQLIAEQFRRLAVAHVEEPLKRR